MTENYISLDINESFNKFIDIHSSKNINLNEIKLSSECVMKCYNSFNNSISNEETECIRKCILNKLENSLISKLK